MAHALAQKRMTVGEKLPSCAGASVGFRRSSFTETIEHHQLQPRCALDVTFRMSLILRFTHTGTENRAPRRCHPSHLNLLPRLRPMPLSSVVHPVGAGGSENRKSAGARPSLLRSASCGFTQAGEQILFCAGSRRDVVARIFEDLCFCVR